MKNLFLIILLIAGINANGQKFYKGYLINKNADTLSVYFTEKPPGQFFNSIEYSTDLNSNDINIADPNRFNEVQYFDSRKIFRSIILDNEEIFGQLLISGSINLYKLNTAREGCNYLIKKNDTVYKLEQEEFKEGNAIKLRNKYIGILNIVMSDCAKLSNKEIAHTGYRDRDLMQLVKAYNSCEVTAGGGMVYDYSKIEDENFKTSRSQWMVNLGVLFPQAEISDSYSLIIDPELIYLNGRPSGIFKYGLGTGVWGVLGKSGSDSWDIGGSSFDVQYNYDNLILIPVSGQLRLCVDNVLALGVGGGYLFSLNKNVDNGWFIKPYMGVVIKQKTIIKFELLHMKLGQQTFPAFGGGFAFCW